MSGISRAEFLSLRKIGDTNTVWAFLVVRISENEEPGTPKCLCRDHWKLPQSCLIGYLHFIYCERFGVARTLELSGKAVKMLPRAIIAAMANWSQCFSLKVTLQYSTFCVDTFMSNSDIQNRESLSKIGNV